jgi:hypothetical protein
MEELDRLLEVVRRFLEAYAAGELKPSPTPPKLGECFESYRSPRIAREPQVPQQDGRPVPAPGQLLPAR